MSHPPLFPISALLPDAIASLQATPRWSWMHCRMRADHAATVGFAAGAVDAGSHPDAGAAADRGAIGGDVRGCAIGLGGEWHLLKVVGTQEGATNTLRISIFAVPRKARSA